MKRIFHLDEKVTLECRGHRVAAEVALVAGNDRAVCFHLDEPVGVPVFGEGMAIIEKTLPVWQDEDSGRLSDLYGNEWRVV
jgi:hypothetical protein